MSSFCLRNYARYTFVYFYPLTLYHIKGWSEINVQQLDYRDLSDVYNRILF